MPLPATPGWVPLPVVVGGPRHSWLGSAGGGGVGCVVCWWGPSPLLAEVPVCYSPPLLAGFRCRWWWAVPATPGWGPLAAVVSGVWRVACGVLVGLWLVCGVVGPSPPLAEVPVCYSPPLLAGFRCRWWWAVPATPGWGPLAAVVCGVWCVVCGVWCVAVVCWWGCGLCVVWLAPRHSWRRSLCATPRHSWLGSAAGGGGRSPPLLAGVRWRRWCGVCGVLVGSLATPGGGPCVLLPATSGWVSLPVVVGGPRHSWLGSAGGSGVRCVACGVWCVGGVVAGVWCGWSLATPGGGSCVVRPATPGWVSLPVVVSGPRHSWLGSAGGGGVWCVVSGVWCVVCGGGVLVGLWLVCGVVGPSPRLAEVPVCHSPPLLAGSRCRWWWAVPATPGWGPLAAVVCGVWCVVCGGGVLVGLWLVCGVVGPSPLLAEVPVCYSPPPLAGFRCRWWWAVPATPGWGPLAAVVCGVWCVAVVRWWGCGWCVVWLVPRHSWRRFLCATPRHSWLGFAAGGGGRSPPLLAGVRWRRWCVVCGVWCVAVVCWWGCGLCVVWLVPRHSWRRSLCATPRHSWLGSAAGGGGRSPPLLAGVCWRRWCGVSGVLVGSLATPGGGPCVLLPATSGWVSLPVVVGGPRHSWLGSAGGSGVRCVACGVWCVGGVVAGRALVHPDGCWCACVFVFFFAWPGRAGRPPGRVLVRPTFSFGRFVFLLCLAPSGLGLPPSLSLPLLFLVALALCFGCFSRPPAAWLSVRSRLVCVSRLAVGCSLVVAPPPPSPFVSRGFRRSCLLPGCFFFFPFFFFLCAPPLSPAFSGFRPRVPWASALALFALLAFRFSALRALLPLSCFPPGCWLLPGGCCPPPPLCVSRFSSLPLSAVCRVVLCVPGCGAAPRCCALCCPVLCCRVLCCARLVPLLVVPCPLGLPVALGPCALRRCVLRCSPALCALCCVCFVVARWCVLLFAALLCGVCVPGCCAVRFLCSPLCAVLCFAVLVRSRCAVRVVRAVAGAWCCDALLCVVLFPVVCRGAVLGLVARGCLLVACFAVGVPVWPRGLLLCGWCGLLWCPAFLCRVLWCCAVAWCCAVVLCCRVAVLLGLALPSCGLSCCAVLCCWLAVLFFARWWYQGCRFEFARICWNLNSPQTCTKLWTPSNSNSQLQIRNPT